VAFVEFLKRAGCCGSVGWWVRLLTLIALFAPLSLCSPQIELSANCGAASINAESEISGEFVMKSPIRRELSPGAPADETIKKIVDKDYQVTYL